MSDMNSAIDFVILWVDGNDPAWQDSFIQAKKSAGENVDASEIRYRDWENLRYWFRGVENFAPWVRRIHFITWGHLPEWLNTSHPKLHVVRHSDYLPEEYRPTFNSNTIELNIHRIDGLADRFVLFNDDTFLTMPNRPEDFFSEEGLPRDMARLSLVQPSSVGHIIYNNLELVNRRHSRKELNRNLRKWLSPKYGATAILKTLTLLPWSFWPGFFDHHLPQPYLKQQFTEAWQVWGKELDASSRNHLRDVSDLSHWLIRYDMLCRGEFSVRNFNDSRLMNLDDGSLEQVCQAVEQRKYRMVCLNDSSNIANFERSKNRLIAAFETILNNKSEYEL